MLKRASSEAKKFNQDNLIPIFERLHALLKQVVPSDKDEDLFSRDRFINAVNNHVDYNSFKDSCLKISDTVREEQKSSAIGGVGDFLSSWLGDDEGFVRIIAKKKGRSESNIELSYRCLDPALVSKPVIEKSFATILMSGTLTPTTMFADLLGFPPKKTVKKELPSPFPQENRLNLIVAKTSTKYTSRSEDQYKEIASILTDIINVTPGNSAIFFPSYYLKDRVAPYLTSVKKTVFQEQQAMSKQEKDEMLEKFKSYVLTGATLLAVGAGSYGEGIDLPGDLLKTVVVVGLPLARPDLETNALIKYYDYKYGRGWDYGYVFPAFNKIIQNAGRVIRSETDRGVIVFLDDRYTEDRYYRCFPPTWRMIVSVNRYKEKIEEFFNNSKS
jgi:DNA excision repair protein ERCC-2